MLLICGTIPETSVSLLTGAAAFTGDTLKVGDYTIPCTQGTAALVSAACVTAVHLKSQPPHVALAGDNGSGQGSRLLYDYLAENLPLLVPSVLLLHYMLPVMGLMKKVTAAAGKCKERPVMIADASAMYAAKAAGLAPLFDVFTPDLAEMAFLADPEAVHPAYISRHLFRTEAAQVPDLLASAYRNKNAATLLLVKGAIDYIAKNGKVIQTITAPDIPAMEAIGGTGDTIGGMIGAFIAAGQNHCSAALHAAKVNRQAGEYLAATPRTKISSIINVIPEILKKPF